MRKSLTYRSSGVSYDVLDAFKRLAQKEAEKTGKSKSRGESAFVWEERDCFRAFVIEGLGTKNLVADEMRKVTGKTYYGAIAQDTVAMIINDLIVVGAAPQVISAYFAVGSSDWFVDTKRAQDLARGWARACKLAGAVWGGGETPTLTNIVAKDAIDLAGSAIGIIKPKSRLMLGNKLTAGDAIVMVESSGIHANGLTLARALAKRLPKAYATKLPNGATYGESLLRPTHIYSALIGALLDAKIDIYYMVNITGHGWRKLMRATRPFTYWIDRIPKPPAIFSFIQKHARLSDREMYATFNMGAGFALFMPEKDANRVIRIAEINHLKAWRAGTLIRGPRRVVIEPLGITYEESTLKVREKPH